MRFGLFFNIQNIKQPKTKPKRKRGGQLEQKIKGFKAVKTAGILELCREDVIDSS